MSRPDIDGASRGLKKRILSASAWTIFGNLAFQATRFAANLVVSRLLFPQAMGLMALATAVLSGLEMFADFGIGQSIIRNHEPTRRFLDTLWSLQIARGWGLWTISVIIAYPMARIYGEPELLYLISTIGLGSIVRGYAHTSQFTLNRDLKLRQLFLLEIGSYSVTVLISVLTAYELRSVWALVIGGLAGALTRTALTYRIAAEPRGHWCWDREVIAELRSFSRWILFSTLLTFIVNQGNSLLLGLFASASFVGLYSIANNIAGSAIQLFYLIGDRVLFPLYGMVGRETTPLLQRRVAKIRLAMMAVVLPPLWGLTCFGDWFVRFLWDPRYHDAGPMLQILSFGSLFLAFGAGPMYLARGDSWIGFVAVGVRAAVLLPAMIAGQYHFGTIGMIWAIAISQAIDYPVEIWIQRRYGVWVPWVDATALGGSIVFIGLGFLLRSALHF
jgi:O-antigen/teichoic acid export membrane protein